MNDVWINAIGDDKMVKCEPGREMKVKGKVILPVQSPSCPTEGNTLQEVAKHDEVKNAEGDDADDKQHEVAEQMADQQHEVTEQVADSLGAEDFANPYIEVGADELAGLPEFEDAMIGDGDGDAADDDDTEDTSCEWATLPTEEQIIEKQIAAIEAKIEVKEELMHDDGYCMSSSSSSSIVQALGIVPPHASSKSKAKIAKKSSPAKKNKLK